MSLVFDRCDLPLVGAGDLSRPSLVFAERLDGRVDADAFGRHDDRSVARFANEVVNGVGRFTPPGVNQTAADGELSAVLAHEPLAESRDHQVLQRRSSRRYSR